MKHMEEYPDEELIDMYRAGNEQAIFGLPGIYEGISMPALIYRLYIN